MRKIDVGIDCTLVGNSGAITYPVGLLNLIGHRWKAVDRILEGAPKILIHNARSMPKHCSKSASVTLT